MDDSYFELFLKTSDSFPPPEGWQPTYGTAGFRANSTLLESTVFRCGVLMAARAMQQKKGTGIVVTASHNPEEDNGIKLIDPSGGMLDIAWEDHANHLSQAKGRAELLTCIRSIFEEQNVPRRPSAGTCVYLARDTRPSGEALLTAAKLGVESLSVPVYDLGILTTPQAHFLVHEANMDGHASEERYFDSLLSGMSGLLGKFQRKEPRILLVDCANGVGAMKLKELGSRQKLLGLELRNIGAGKLNDRVGSDFVQKERLLPLNMTAEDGKKRCASIDGDADRLVYFTLGDDHCLRLFDGDKIATLAAIFIKDLLSQLPPDVHDSCKVGVVQTAYANGASTCYIKEVLKLDVTITPTGVKHLHCAAERYDIGIYFEANGHGTILFSQKFVARMDQLGGHVAEKFLHLRMIINQCVGDAISGIFMVEAILMLKDWGLDDWDAVYIDYPSRQLKVAVPDRTAVKTCCAETRCYSPPGLQEEIDRLVSTVESGRSFVRPSGTEDVVRVYAEASSQESADWLAQQVALATHRLLEGSDLSTVR